MQNRNDRTTFNNVYQFCNAVKESKCPKGATVDLFNSHVGNYELREFIIKALLSGKCPNELVFDLRANMFITDEGATSILTALKNPACPVIANIDFGASNKITPEIKKEIEATLEKNKLKPLIKESVQLCSVFEIGLFNKLPPLVRDNVYKFLYPINDAKSQRFFSQKIRAIPEKAKDIAITHAVENALDKLPQLM